MTGDSDEEDRPSGIELAIAIEQAVRAAAEQSRRHLTLAADRAANPETGAELGPPLPRYQPPPSYDDGCYLSEPSTQDEKRQSPSPQNTSSTLPPAPSCESAPSGSSSLAPPPPPPRYSRSPSPTAGPSRSRWPKASFPDGPTIVLSLDAGGGGHTMKQLDALETLMWKISSSLGHICPWGKGPNVLKPCDVFHLIVGSGTGGLIAILLGRLQMSVQAVKEFYSGNWEYIFRPLMELQDVKVPAEPRLPDTILRIGHGVGVLPKSARAVATERLEEKLAWIVKIRNRGVLLRHPEKPSLGKVLLTAMQHEPGSFAKTVKLRSYPSSSGDDTNPTIVEAARAAMAHPAFFKPVKMADTPGEWTGSPAAYSNPVSLVLEECVGFGNRNVLVSVGAGMPNAGRGDGADKATAGPEKQPAKMSFDDVMDSNARLCAQIERDAVEEDPWDVRVRRWHVFGDAPKVTHRHFRLSHASQSDVAEEAATVIRNVRRERIRRERGFLRVEETGQMRDEAQQQRDEAERQPPVQPTLDSDECGVM